MKNVILEYAVHTLCGTLLFLLFLIPAVTLNVLLGWLKALRVIGPLIWVLLAAEWAVVLADVMLLSVILWKTTWQAVKRL